MNRRRAFEAAPASVAASRRFVQHQVSDLAPELQSSAVLMVSELATNSLTHASSGFEVSVDRTERHVRVEVADRGDGRPSLRQPAATEPHGRGLQIVRELADEWGVLDGPGRGKTVWFQMRTRDGGSTATVDGVGLQTTGGETPPGVRVERSAPRSERSRERSGVRRRRDSDADVEARPGSRARRRAARSPR